MRRLIAVVLVGVLVGGAGCATNSYRIPSSELQRLAQLPPEQRGEHVRVEQEISSTDVPTAQRVEDNTPVGARLDFQVHFVPRTHGGHVGGGGGGTFGGGGGKGGDGKAAAIVFLVVAAIALVAIAAVEGERFDGYARLHPMHPVHLISKDGLYAVLPLAWIDPQTAAWTDTAIVKRTEGPFLHLERAPLTRTGGNYNMFAGTGSFKSADGSLDLGPSFTVQAGFFATQEIGLVASAFLGWRANRLNETLFESRYTLELQVMPLAAGIFHGGVYGGAGYCYRFEDGFDGAGDSGGRIFTGGAQLQLDINTRLALTARFGVAQGHDEYMKDILVGLAVY